MVSQQVLAQPPSPNTSVSSSHEVGVELQAPAHVPRSSIQPYKRITIYGSEQVSKTKSVQTTSVDFVNRDVWVSVRKAFRNFSYQFKGVKFDETNSISV